MSTEEDPEKGIEEAVEVEETKPKKRVGFAVSIEVASDEEDVSPRNLDGFEDDKPPVVKKSTRPARSIKGRRAAGRDVRFSSVFVGGAPRDRAEDLTDHHTLHVPSSTIRFRGSSVRIYEQRSSQIQLQGRVTDDGEDQVVVKKVKDHRPFGLNCVRFVYTLVALFFSGFLFIFCWLVVLFVFMDFVAKSGDPSYENAGIPGLLASLFSVPIFILTLASIMTIAGLFVVDTWSGQPLMKQVGNINPIAVELYCFVLFLGVPLLAWIVALFVRYDDWWTVALLSWFSSLALYYVLFVVMVIYYEITSAMWILREIATHDTPRKELFKQAILIRLKHQLAGVAYYNRMVNIKTSEDLTAHYERPTWGARFTMLPGIRKAWIKLDPPRRIYDIPALLGVKHFVTKYSWSLEKLFFMTKRSTSIAIVKGPAALRPDQMRSSFWCSLIANILIILLAVGILVWVDVIVIWIIIIVIVLVLCCVPRIRSSVRVYSLYKEVTAPDDDVLNEQDLELWDAENRDAAVPEEDEDEDEEESYNEKEDTDGIYATWEKYHVTHPTNSLIWTLFTFEIALLVLFPLIGLWWIGNYPVASIFLIAVVVSGFRYFLDPCTLVQELGSFEQIGKDEAEHAKSLGGDEEVEKSTVLWKAKSRLSNILLNISRGPRRNAWLWIYLVLSVIVIIIAFFSYGDTAQSSESTTESMTITPLNDFVYPPQPDLPYPSCQMAKGLEIPGSNTTALGDYAFIAALTYQPPDTIQTKLDQYFGEGVLTNQEGIVEEFRTSVEGGGAPISYNFFTNDQTGFGIVAVRGTTGAWETLVDSQLWSGAALFGLFRFILPFGQAFTPMMDELLRALNGLQSNIIKDIAIYKQTTKFVKALQASGNYTKIHITGQSLGGGAAIITGAQVGIPAIAISGPNAMMSRKTFDPPITEDAINTYTFNVVPDRDIVPRVDDLGRLYQRIQCRAPRDMLFACHTAVRSLCEITYTCGTGKRPPLCQCATSFGYPEPDQLASTTFTEQCGSQRSNRGE